jgi:hypothetical protein
MGSFLNEVQLMKLDYESTIAGVRQGLNEKGFLPFGAIKLGKRTLPGITLHEAFRNAIGMKPDDSVYMYWEWEELNAFISGFWVAIDNAASVHLGRRTTGIALAFDETRSLAEMDSLLKKVEFAQVNSLESITRRPTRNEASIRFVGKLLGACLSTLAVIETTTSCGYGDLISSLSTSSVSNVNLLKILDERAKSIGIPLGDLSAPESVLIPRALGWAFEKFNADLVAEDQSQLSLAEFFVETESSANWAGLSDQSVLRRLLVIAPEKAEGQIKAITKFLRE